MSNAYSCLPHDFAIGVITNALITWSRCTSGPATGKWLVTLPTVGGNRTARCVIDDFGTLVEVPR